MDLKTLIEKLLTVAPPGAVVKDVFIDLGPHQTDDSSGKILEIMYDKYTKTIVIQGG